VIATDRILYASNAGNGAGAEGIAPAGRASIAGPGVEHDERVPFFLTHDRSI
jgi:hypothetical protein